MFKKLLFLLFIVTTIPSHGVDPLVKKEMENKIDVIVDDYADVIAALVTSQKIDIIFHNVNEFLDKLIDIQKKKNNKKNLH